MIEYKWLKIESKSDYDKIIDLLPEKFKENPYIKVWVEELKLNIGNKCTQICIEYPYYDPEYLSSYYLYYVKKFQDIGKKSVRMHFFGSIVTEDMLQSARLNIILILARVICRQI